MTDRSQRPLALVTGASSGIGYCLAHIAARQGCDLIVAADTPLADAVADFESLGARVQSLEVDLASREGTDRVLQAAATAAAAVVDLALTPQRSTPGFERRLSARSLVMVYGAFALGVAAGSFVARR